MRFVQFTVTVAVLLAAHSADVFVTGDTPKPSDTNNLPATPAPSPNNNNNNGQTPAPSASTAAPGQQTPAPTQTPAATTQSPTTSPSPTPSPTPSASAANNNNNNTAATTPQPSPTTPVPSNNSTSSESSSKEAADTSTSASPDATSSSTTTPVSNQTADDSNSGGMSAGAVVGIIIAVLAALGVGGFFLYRHLRASGDEADGGHGYNANGDGGKHFDYPVNSPTEVTVMGGGSHQTDYSLAKMERQSSQDMPIMAGGSMLSSINNSSYASSSLQNTYNNNNNSNSNSNSNAIGFGNNYGNANNYTSNNNNNNNASASTAASGNVTLYSEPSSVLSSPPAFAKSTSRFLNGPDQESPPFKKTDVQLSRPSTSNLDEPMEFNHSFAESYAESYSESYSDGGYMNSFVQGMPGSEGLSVGRESSAMGDALDRDTSIGNNENAHWLDAMDEMRDTGDSYAMLESDAYGSERGSAIDDRFSTDSEYTSSTSRQL